MLVIRLARYGRTKKPTYRLVLQEREWAPSSKVIEYLGRYDPHTTPSTIDLKTERIQYWMQHGAQPSATIHNMLVTAGLVKGKKRRVVFGKKKQNEEEVKVAEKSSETEEKTKEAA